MTNSRKYYKPKGSEFLERVEANTPGAVGIEYQLRDGTAGHYFACKKEYLRGVIESIYFKEGNFGKSLMINLRTSSLPRQLVPGMQSCHRSMNTRCTALD